MKKRRILIISLLLVAALTLGIGYAALTDVLDINGTADVTHLGAQTSFDENIYFESATATNAGDHASVVVDDPDMASFTANSLQGAGDTATFTFVIKNNSDLDALVTPSLAADGNTNSTYFDIVSDWNAQPRTIDAGATANYVVTVTLKQTPTDAIHGAFHIELTATADEVVNP